MTTEQQNPRTANIDQLPTSEILECINAEDVLVAQVV
jgi:N-acetylmuramic acid 6-phosphate (MurNAc-6-P) etherase